MRKEKMTLAAMLFIVVVLFLATGCGEGARVGDLQTMTETVELGDAESVDVEIE